MEILKNKWVVIGVFIFMLLIAIGCGYLAYYYHDLSNKECICENINNEVIEKEEIAEEVIEKYYVEVKGAIKKAGVYEVTKGSIINDIINIAGGFNKNAYTNNINLSKKVVDEMVIYVYTKSEYKKVNTPVSTDTCSTSSYDISDCITDNSSVIILEENTTTTTNSTDSSNNSLININTADVNTLSTLPGIGTSKAESIIAYREEHGNFKAIEELTNVSGIGESTYEKLKAYITI